MAPAGASSGCRATAPVAALGAVRAGWGSPHGASGRRGCASPGGCESSSRQGEAELGSSREALLEGGMGQGAWAGSRGLASGRGPRGVRPWEGVGGCWHRAQHLGSSGEEGLG